MTQATISYETPLSRLQQTLSHIQESLVCRDAERLAIVEGPTEPRLWEMTLGELLEFQCLRYGDSEALVVPWTGTRWTYAQLNNEANRLARGLLAQGIKRGDTVGVMAGNCEQYVALFFAAGRIGAILVVINNTYTPPELIYALSHAGMSQTIPRARQRGGSTSLTFMQVANCSSSPLE
ncbi:hypothetical protein VTO42DRAFT_1717 [Malbranchea cinnamomea]